MHHFFRALMCLLLAAFYNSVSAECERINYEFQGPDEYIQHIPTTAASPRGTMIISHGGTSGRAGPLSQGWASFFNANGFDAVILNHYPQRGLTSRSCKATLAEAASWRRDDTAAVLQWLEKSKNKAAENIVLTGFSAGSAAVFPFVTNTKSRKDRPNATTIKAGIVFYPWANGCLNPPAPLITKMLFVAASEDNVFRCWKSSAWLKSSVENLMSVSVIEGALHAFDNPSIKERTCATEGKYPYCMEYGQQAHRQSEAIVLEFLSLIGL